VLVQLAIGTGKGALIIFDQKTGQKTTATGKHKKRIVCGELMRGVIMGSHIAAGDWNLDNKLAYASEDRQVSECRDGAEKAGRESRQGKLTCRLVRLLLNIAIQPLTDHY
jgi:hypothetical protein